MTKTFSSKSNAKRAAIAAIGAEAIEAEDYTVIQDADGRWIWDAVQKPVGDSPVAHSRPRRYPRGQGATATSESRNASTRAETKQSRLIAMLRGEGGATVDEIAAAFSWQRHYADFGIRSTPCAAPSPARSRSGSAST